MLNLTKLAVMALIAIVTMTAFAAAPRFSNDTLIIKMKDAGVAPQHQLISSSKNLFGKFYVVKTNNLFELERSLENDLNVQNVERNYYSGKREIPSEEPIVFGYEKAVESSFFNDPKASKVWALRDASRHGVSVDKAYLSPVTNSKTKVIVAIVDTGVDYNHEDLKDVMWINDGEIAGNGIDDDNNGYIDDVHGINTLVRDSSGNATGNPMASHSHGTHVAGTIGATQNNNIGIPGIASNVKIMAIRTVPDNGDETDVDVTESYIYAAKHGAKLINCSFGKTHNEGGMMVSEAIDFIGQEYGTLVVAAAGNDYKTDIDKVKHYPASFTNETLMVIASTTNRGALSSFSNIGKISIDLAAPGSSVYSTVPGDRYASMSGTSMATPTTVGVAAEVLSNFPELGPVELKNVLMETVTPVSRFIGLMQAEGRVDLYNALNHALEADSFL